MQKTKEESDESKKEEALKVSLKEGASASFSTSISDSYITPFVLALNGKSIHVGILSSIAGLISPIAQFFGSKLMERKSRKNIVVNFMFLQAIIWLPIAALGFLSWRGILEPYLIYMLMALYALIALLGGLKYPAWYSWMGDIVPEEHRGEYFSKRNRILGVVGMIAFLLGGFILDFFREKEMVIIGFSILCILAFFFGIDSFRLLKKQYHPKFKLEKGYYFSLLDFIKRFDNYGKFAVYQAFFNFSIMIASPFFAVYMLKELGMENNYVLFTIISMSSSIFYLIFAPLAGKFSDKYGNRPLFIIGSLLFSMNPLLWIFIKDPLLLIFVPQLIVGIANAAFVIAINNFTYDAVTPQHRGICIAYTNILSGIGIFIGSLLGGVIISYAHPSYLSPFIFLFIIATLSRLFVALFFIPQIKEEKKVKRLSTLHMNIIHPFKTIHAEIGVVKHFVAGNKNRKI